MGNPAHSKYPNDEARRCFGQTLTRWLERGGWSCDLPMRWGHAANFPAVADSTLNRLQNGRIEQPYPITFIQFGILNDRLARQDYGLPDDDPMLERLAQQRPIVDADGRPWAAADFFALFIGDLEPPEWAMTPPMPTKRDAVKVSEEVRLLFARLAQEQGMTLLEAWRSFEEARPKWRPPLLSRAELEVVRNVLAGWHTWTPEELQDLQTLEGGVRPLLALERWNAELSAVMGQEPAGEDADAEPLVAAAIKPVRRTRRRSGSVQTD